MDATRRAVVVGGGMGGLAAACDLARGGFAVTVVEREARAGGKVRREQVAGAGFDAGPTVLTMRAVFEALFNDAGADFDAAVTTRPAELLARHAWPDGSRLDLFADHARTFDAIAAFAGPAEARAWQAFLTQAATIHAEVEGPFIHGPRPTVASLIAARGMGLFGSLRRIDSFRTMWAALSKQFQDARLRQLFGRYATYCGSSPFLAPATLNLIAFVEQQGVWLVQGGIGALADAVARLATDLGVGFRFEQDVVGLLGTRRVEGVRLATGEELPADVVVLNAGQGMLAAGHLGPLGQKASGGAPPRSLSALTACAVARADGFPLAFHNVFFSPDYPAEFDALFGRGRYPADPTVYICAQDRDGFCTPPTGPERLFILINAPPTGDTAPAAGEIEAAWHSALATLDRAGLALDVSAERMTTPAAFADRFRGTGGGLYGPPTHGWRASLARPDVRTRLPGLYLAGGEVHPGAGVPMATLSGRLAAATALAEAR